MLKSILGLAVRTADNSSTNARHLCRLNAVNFCKTCTLYENEPISSLTRQYVDGHDIPSRWASWLIKVRGFSFNSVRTTSLFSSMRAVCFAPTFVARLSCTLPVDSNFCIKREITLRAGILQWGYLKSFLNWHCTVTILFVLEQVFTKKTRSSVAYILTNELDCTERSTTWCILSGFTEHSAAFYMVQKFFCDVRNFFNIER